MPLRLTSNYLHIAMPRKARLRVIFPSSKTVVELFTSVIVSPIKDPNLDISVHFSRFRVARIDVSEDTDSQFQLEKMLTAAQLLADAEVDVIGWSETSAG